jgi:hypothetical protein
MGTRSGRLLLQGGSGGHADWALPGPLDDRRRCLPFPFRRARPLGRRIAHDERTAGRWRRFCPWHLLRDRRGAHRRPRWPLLRGLHLRRLGRGQGRVPLSVCRAAGAATSGSGSDGLGTGSGRIGATRPAGPVPVISVSKASAMALSVAAIRSETCASRPLSGSGASRPSVRTAGAASWSRRASIFRSSGWSGLAPGTARSPAFHLSRGQPF